MNFGANNQAANIQASADIQAQTMADNTQMQMFNQEQAVQKGNYDTAEGQLQPFLQAGQTAAGQLSADTAPGGSLAQNFSLSDLTQDPGYQFDLQQGTQAVQRSAAAAGTLNSGGTLKAISNYTTGLASNEINNAYNRYITNQNNQFNRLSSLAGIGTNALGQSVNAGSNYTNASTQLSDNTANQVSNNQLTTTVAAGNATAGGVVGGANFLNGTLGNLVNNVSQYASNNDTSMLGAVGSLAGLL